MESPFSQDGSSSLITRIRQRLTPKSKGDAVLILVSIFLTVFGAVMFMHPIAQWDSYHHFADGNTILGIPNFWNVVSNLSFLWGGLAGMLFMLRQKNGGPAWWPYLFFFLGSVLTAAGSSYYHWSPGNERLLFDRLPMTLMFMSLFCAMIAELIHEKAGKILLAPMLLLGVGTVFNWINTQSLGLGDLRFYGVVQFFPMVAVPLILIWFPARFTHSMLLLQSLGLYALAKVCEQLDAPIYHLIGLSGHTIKHVLAGMSVYWIYRFLKQRQPVAQTTTAKEN